MTSSLPAIGSRGPAASARMVVLLLHGGQEKNTAPDTYGLAWARMLPFAWASRRPDTAVWLLRYRVRGWNAPAEDPVIDARWALGEARLRHPGAPILLVGHSMGGRTALRLSADPDVAGVCALAPWIERGEPWQPTQARVLIAHGENDTVTDPRNSADYARQTGATFVNVERETHPLLRRPLYWQRLVRDFVGAEFRNLVS